MMNYIFAMQRRLQNVCEEYGKKPKYPNLKKFYKLFILGNVFFHGSLMPNKISFLTPVTHFF